MSAVPKTKFIVSFTTSPTRINKCGPMINSILDQTRKPDLFLLNIPEEFARTGETYIVPKYIRKSLTVNRISTDYGPATKIIPTVAYLSDRDRSDEYNPEYTRIIYLDDDIAYPKKMVETYERMIAPNDHNVWTSTGFDFVNMDLHGKRGYRDTATIAEGYGSVCVKLNTFGDDFMEYITRYTAIDNQICRLSDDVILSNYYHRRNLGIFIMNLPGFLSINDIWQEQKILDYGNEADALHLGAGGTSDNNVDRYKRVITALNKNKERKFKLSFITTETDVSGVIRQTLIYR
jgi:hypothetical protein